MPRYYTDEEDIERIRIQRRERSPAPVHYVEPRTRTYYQSGVDALLGSQERTLVATTRVRERSRERRSPPVVVTGPAPTPHAPVIIKQNFHDHHHSSDDDSSIGSSSYHHHHRRGRSRHESVYSRHSNSHSRSRAGSDAYLTLERYEMERRLDETRRQLELLRASAPHTERERLELERERERLRRDRHELELEAEERDREARRLAEQEVRDLRRDRAELERVRAEEIEDDRLQLVRRDMEFRDLREQQVRAQRERELSERRAHEQEDYELREAKRKLQRIEERERREKEALERAREAKTQAELKAAKDELEKSECTLAFFFPSFCLLESCTTVTLLYFCPWQQLT